ncbi:hypothetical protein [Burkholderia alba]|uniref:hypothetical protein n=1 Tax=Burkholderia alba TaxID=2683677 RepID=UPI002B05A55B|nr:hypothetical protein [Burkholderia alba]
MRQIGWKWVKARLLFLATYFFEAGDGASRYSGLRTLSGALREKPPVAQNIRDLAFCRAML